MFILRFLQLFYYFCQYNCFFIFGLLNSKSYFFLRSSNIETSKRRAKRLVKFCTKAGPFYIKLGQIMVTRVDIFNDIYINELKKLRDSVKAVDTKDIIKVIEQDFGLDINSIFSHISNTPLASASIAQVHKAKLFDGSEVVVKVIKPSTLRIFNRDIVLLKFIFGLIQRFSKRGKIAKPLRIINNLQETTRTELDLRFEAAMIEEFKDNFKNDTTVYIPKVYWNYVSVNVLVEEFVEGTPLSDINKLRKMKYDLNNITKSLTKIFFLQTLRDGYFHGDMHAGNIIINKNGVISLLDFGIMGRLSLFLKGYLYDLFLALLNKDYKRAAEIHFEAGWVSNKYSVDSFALACRYIVSTVMNRPQKEVKIGEIMQKLFLISGNFNMEIQEELLLLQKNMMYLENLARELSPYENIWVLSKEIIEQNIDRKKTLKDRFTHKQMFFINEASNIKNIITNSLVETQRNNQIMLENLTWMKRLFVLIIIIILVSLFFS